MSIQYNDSVFSDNMTVDKTIEKMHELLKNNIPFQAVHFGTDRELTERKNELIAKHDMQIQIDKIKEQLENMSISPTSKLLHIPTAEDVIKFNK